MNTVTVTRNPAPPADHTCATPMRVGVCRLDAGHRGRHASVVWFCDYCDKPRRGTPAAQTYDRDGENLVSVCWPCHHKDNRAYRRSAF
jgi:hypothetical protein